MLRRATVPGKIIAFLVAVTLVAGLWCVDFFRVRAAQAVVSLPQPNQLLSLSTKGDGPSLKGVTFDPAQSDVLTFLVDRGSLPLSDPQRAAANARLVRYFLAGLVTPAERLWVNLSPYEPDAVIEDEHRATELGQDMLKEDYLLKMLASSLTHPDTASGKEYWTDDGAKSASENKVWIKPGKMDLYAQGNVAVLGETSLAIEAEQGRINGKRYADLMREVNENVRFADVRQMYRSLLLAMWFKEQLQGGVYATYRDTSKVGGIANQDAKVVPQIFKLYERSFDKGVYRVARKDVDGSKASTYFSGGIGWQGLKDVAGSAITLSRAKLAELTKDSRSFDTVHVSCSTLAYGSKGAATSSSLSVSSPDLFPVLPVSAQDALIDQAMLKSYAPRSDYNGKDVGLALDAIAQPRCTVKQRSELLAFVRRYKPVDFFGKKAMSREVFFKTIALMKRADGEAMDAASRESLAWLLHMSAFWSDTFTKASLNSEMVADLVSLIRRMQGNETIRHKLIQVLYLTGKRREALAEAALDRTHVADIAALMQDAQGGDFDLLRRFFVATYATQPAIRDHLISLGSDWAAILNGMPQDWAGQYYDSVIETYSTVYSHRVIGEVFVDQVGTKNISQKKSSVLAMQLKRARYVYEKDLERSRERLAAMPPWQRYMMQAWSRFTRKSMVPKFTFDLEKDPALLDPITKGTEAFYKLSWVDFVKGMDDHSAQKAKTQGGSESDAAKDFDVLFPSLSTAQEKALIAEANDLKSNGKMKTAEDVKKILRAIALPIRPDENGMDAKTRQRLANVLCWMAAKSQIHSGVIDGDIVKSLLALISLPDGSGMDEQTRQKLADALYWMAESNQIPSGEIDKDMVKSLLTLIFLPDGSGMDAKTRHHLAGVLLEMAKNNKIPSAEIDKDMVESLLALISLPDGSGMDAQTRQDLATALYWMVHKNQIPSGEIDKDMVESFLALISLPDGSEMNAQTRSYLAEAMGVMFRDPAVRAAVADLGYEWGVVLADLPAGFYEKIGRVTDAGGNSVPTDVATKLIELILAQALLPQNDQKQSSLRAMQLKRAWYRHEKAVKAAEENKQPAPEFVFDPVTAAPIEEGTEALYKLPWNTFVTQMSAHESDNQIVSKRDRRVYDRESLEVAFVHASHMNDGDGRIALADGLVPAEFVSEMFDALFYFDVRKTPQGINYARAIDQFFKAPVSLDYRLTVDQAEDSLNLLIDERVTDSVRDYFSNVWKNYVLPAFPVGGLAGLHLETFISLCDAFHGYSLYDSQELAFAFFNEARIRALFAGALSGDQFNRLAEIVNTTSNAELKTAAGRFLAAEYMRSHALRETLRQSQHEWAVVLHEMPEAFFPQAAKIIERADAAYDVFADMTTVSSKIPNEEARGAKVSMQLKRAWYRHEKAVKAAEENKQPVPEFVFDPEKNQVDAALIEVGTEVFYKLPWADFVKGMDAYAAKGSKADAQESAAASKNDKDLFPVLSDAEQDALIARVRPLVVTQDYDISSDEIAMLFDALVLPRCSVDDQKAILTFMQNSVQSASWETLGAYEFDKFISYLSSLSMRSNVDFEIRTAMTILQNLAYYDVFSQRSITYAQLDSLIELLRIHEHSWIDSGSIAGTIWMMLAQNSLDVSVFTASDIVRLYEFAVFLSQTHVNRENDIDERRAVAGLLLQMISTRKDLLESFALSQSLEWPLIVETMPIDFKTGIFREALRSEAVAAAVDFEFLPPLLDAIVSQYSKHSSDQEETNVVFMYLKRAWYRHEKAVEAAKTAGKPVPEFVFDLKNSNDAALIEVGTEAFYKLPWADFVKGMDEYFGNAALVVEPVNTDAVFSAPDASRYAGLADYVYVEGHPTEMFFSFWKEIVHDHTELQYGLSVDLYNKICTTVAADPQARIEGVAPRYVTLIRSLYEKRNGILPALTDEEAHTINTLSVDVGRAFDLAKKKGRIKLLAEPTFRTTVRQFVEVFSKYYLQDRTSALDHVFEYFMLTAWTVYGRMLTPDSRREFASVMQEVFRKEKYEMLFVRSSVSRGGGFEEHQIDALFDHGRFDAVGKSYVDDGNEPQTYDAVRAAVSRAESAGMTACVKVPSGYQIPDAVYRSLSATGADVISVSMGGFTQTADLFGRNAFDKDGNPQWVPGKIEEALAYAQRYPEKKVYFLLESPEDAPPHVLTSLHSLLLEHTFKPEGAAARERGEQRIPPNMQVVLVQSAQAQIDDPAFVDRSAAYTLSDVTDDDLRRFIAHETNDQEVADAVIAARTHFSKVFPKIDVFSEDLLFVARNGALRHASGEAVGTVVAEEMFMHFAAKHAAQDDALRVKIAVALGLSPQWKPRIELARTETGWMLNAQGVQVPVDPTGQFGAYLAAHPEVAALGFAAALAASRGEDYFVTDTEVNVMTLLARAHISGNAVLLQGASGEGKTTVNRVFMDIAGRVRHEMTINAETDKNLFESAAMITHQGVRLRESDFERAAKSSGQGFLFNEADTQPFIFSYLRPQIMQRDLQKNMYVFTGNIRDELPLSIARALACTYRVESSDVDTKQIAQRLMERECGKTIAGQYTDRLYAIFKLLRKAALDRETESHREVTRRELGRFAALFAARMRAGDTPDDAFAFATEIIFVRMWQTDADMQFAREIAQANNVTRWPTYDAVVSFVRTYRGHVPMMTVGQTGDLFGSDEVVTRLPLSRFHTKSALVGGLGRTPSDSKAAESYGVLPQLMLAARLDPVHTHRAVLDGYLDLHPDAAPLFNEFFPTGELDVSAVAQNPDVVADVLSRIVAAKQEANVIAEYNARYPNAALPASIEVYTPMQRLALVTFALSIRPKNLLFAAVEQYPSVNEPDEGLHPADIDRFMVVNLNRELTPQSGYDVVYAACGNKYAAAFAQAAVDSFSAQHRAGLYPHMRFSFAQLDAFAAEVKRRGLIDRHAVAVLAWLMLGNGLLDRTDGDEREDYLAAFVHTLGIDQSKVTVDRQYRTGEKGRVELVFPVADEGRELFSIVRNTAYVRVMDQGRGYYDVDDGKKVSRIRLQAPLPELLVQQSIAILAEDNGLDVVFEGDPGGGKTTSLRDLSRAEGRSVVEEPMSADSILASLLGGPVFRDKAFHVTSGEQDASGAFVLPFLRAYTQGGRFIADEGACGENADHVLRWISRVAHMPSFDLGTFVPGMQGTIITRSPEFRFAVTQNLHFATGGRRPVPGAVDGRALFAYVPNVLTQDAAETLIRYYADGVPLSVDLTARLARVHILLSKEHPQKRMLSPRDLIDMIALLGKGGVDSASVHEALRITYVGSLSLPQDREKVVAAIATVFPGFSATGSRYDLSPKQTQSVPAELAPWLNVASYRQALVAYTRALSSQGRQVLLIEPKGGNAVDFLKCTRDIRN
jgi:MoxR-like ATPase